MYLGRVDTQILQILGGRTPRYCQSSERGGGRGPNFAIKKPPPVMFSERSTIRFNIRLVTPIHYIKVWTYFHRQHSQKMLSINIKTNVEGNKNTQHNQNCLPMVNT